MQLNHYEAGALDVDALVKAVPDVRSLAELQLEQIVNVIVLICSLPIGAAWWSGSVRRSLTTLNSPEW
jgi:hypothetical protein